MSGFRIEGFDTWQSGYGAAAVAVYQAGSTALASVFFDEDLTIPAPNPLTLASRSMGGVNYGKFSAPVYVGVPVELRINSIDQSGIIRPPLTTLDDEDASDAVLTATGGTAETSLADFAARTVNVVDHGEFKPTSDLSASSSTNAATLALAIGVIAALGGGQVITPPGTFSFTSFSLPAYCLVGGAGVGVTVLQSVLADKVVTLSGDSAGLKNLTLDGVSLQASSIGIFAEGKNKSVFENVLVKRFNKGQNIKGGWGHDWKRFDIDTCAEGADLDGDTGTGSGTDFIHNRWQGHVGHCTTHGVRLKYVDKKVWNNDLAIAFEDNTGTALIVEGARHTDISGSWFKGNTADLEILDGSDTSHDDENTVVGFNMRGGTISSAMSFTGLCQDVIFKGVDLQGGTYTLTTLTNNILALDCLEDSSVALAGSDATKWNRARSILGDSPGSFGLTTNNSATEGWSYDMAPGERIAIEATIIATGRNVDDYAMYHIYRGAHRPPSTLAYDGQTANFTPGQTLTGVTSGTTARIVADTDSGATGTLKLTDIVGEFVDDEAITDGAGGAALANGVMSHQNAALLGSTIVIATAIESDSAWGADFGVTAGKAIINVTGNTSKTVEWTVSARVTSSG